MKIIAFGLPVVLLLSVSFSRTSDSQKMPDLNNNKWALVIGISDYRNYGLDNKLKYADRDAQQFMLTLKEKQGGSFPDKQVKLLTNSSASRRNIFDAIDDISRRARGKDSLFYFFFSGHSEKDPKDNQIYFMPHDGDPRNPMSLGIKADELLSLLRRRIETERIVYFIDACHAGSAVRQGRKSGINEANHFESITNSIFKPKEADERFPMGFLSSRDYQYSFEDDGFRHGIFTWYLLRGIQDCEAYNLSGDSRDGIVSIGDLEKYLLDKVENYTKEKFGKENKQSPVVSGSNDPDFPVGFCKIKGMVCFSPNININASSTEIKAGETVSLSTPGVVDGKDYGNVFYYWNATPGANITGNGKNASLDTASLLPGNQVEIGLIAATDANSKCTARGRIIVKLK